uniref:Uncharacterized protein n=1 Tax=Romanomermis culicivorax TaxID=13658 RepID=A0A915JR32_ROMCU
MIEVLAGLSIQIRFAQKTGRTIWKAISTHFERISKLFEAMFLNFLKFSQKDMKKIIIYTLNDPSRFVESITGDKDIGEQK